MEFIETRLAGARLVRLTPSGDDRGSFARLYCSREFQGAGLASSTVQTNLSKNRMKGTLRGLHFQEAPHGEAKLVQCIRGRMLDVIVDLRIESPTFRQWQGFELVAEGNDTLFIPEGYAHGFQTLEDDTWVLYHMFSFFHAASASGIRWDDPDLEIDWPLPSPVMSGKDRDLPRLETWLAARPSST